MDSSLPSSKILDAGSQKTAWVSVAGLVFLVVSVAWLTLYRLGSASLWLDEAYTWYFVRQNWADMFIAIRLDGVHPPLYYMLLKPFVSLASLTATAPSTLAVLSTAAVPYTVGQTEIGLRLFSVLANLVGLLFSALLGRRVGRNAGALAGVWFWAYHPAALLYARDARPYALLAMLSAASLYFFLSAAVSSTAQASASKLNYCLGGIALASGLLVHYFFLLTYGITLLAALMDLPRRRLFFRRWVMVALIALIPLLAWLLWFLRLENPSFGIGWIQTPSLSDLPLTLWNLFSGYGGANALPGMLYGIAVTGLVLVSLVAKKTRRFSLRWFSLGLLLPVAGVWLISLQRPVYIDRYFLVILPFVSILVSAGASASWEWMSRTLLPSKRVVVLALCLTGFAMLGIVSGWQVHSDPKYTNEDWRGLVTYLNHQQPVPSTTPDLSQVWFKDPASSIPFSYYNQANYQVIQSEQPPICQTPCWWPLRQPYTVTHAFTQSITDPSRPWKPDLPSGCQILDAWESSTNLALWKVQCK